MDTIQKKLLAIQAALKAPKNQRNTFGNYNYRSCEDILEEVKPLAHAEGCTVSMNDELMLIGERYYVKATATLSDGENPPLSATAYAREEENKKGMDGSQITGAASSYARKYALNALFAIDDSKDSDATNTHGKEQATAAKPKPDPVKQKQAEPKGETAELAAQIERMAELAGIDFVGLEKGCMKHFSKNMADLNKEELEELGAMIEAKSKGGKKA